MAKKKIIFVCTGNTCRSPMAEIIFKAEMKKRNITTVTVKSAGIAAGEGGINPKSAAVLKEKGYRVGKFTPTQLDEKLLKDALAIICMTEGQREKVAYAVERVCGEGEGKKVQSFYSLAGDEVPDPYGKDIDCYRYVFEIISMSMNKIFEKIDFPKEDLTNKPQKRGRPKKQTVTTEKKEN